jgi:hypothetical protein
MPSAPLSRKAETTTLLPSPCPPALTLPSCPHPALLPSLYHCARWRWRACGRAIARTDTAPLPRPQFRATGAPTLALADAVRGKLASGGGRGGWCGRRATERDLTDGHGASSGAASGGARSEAGAEAAEGGTGEAGAGAACGTVVCEEPIDLRGLQLHAAEPGELGKTGFGHGSLDGSALLSGALCTAAGAAAAAAGCGGGGALRGACAMFDLVGCSFLLLHFASTCLPACLPTNPAY